MKEVNIRWTLLAGVAGLFYAMVYQIFVRFQNGTYSAWELAISMGGALFWTLFAANALLVHFKQSPAFMDVLRFCLVSGMYAFATSMQNPLNHVRMLFMRTENALLFGILLGVIVIGILHEKLWLTGSWFNWRAGWNRIWYVFCSISVAAFLLALAESQLPYHNTLVRTALGNDYLRSILAGPLALLSFDGEGLTIGTFAFYVVPLIVLINIIQHVYGILGRELRQYVASAEKTASATQTKPA